jgi:hypothetical protein
MTQYDNIFLPFSLLKLPLVLRKNRDEIRVYKRAGRKTAGWSFSGTYEFDSSKFNNVGSGVIWNIEIEYGKRGYQSLRQ